MRFGCSKVNLIKAQPPYFCLKYEISEPYTLYAYLSGGSNNNILYLKEKLAAMILETEVELRSKQITCEKKLKSYDE